MIVELIPSLLVVMEVKVLGRGHYKLVVEVEEHLTEVQI